MFKEPKVAHIKIVFIIAFQLFREQCGVFGSNFKTFFFFGINERPQQKFQNFVLE